MPGMSLPLLYLLLPLIIYAGSFLTTNHERSINYANNALQFCKANNYNTDYCILIDMTLHSGKNRMFIWDFKENKPMNSFPVSHGSCYGEFSAVNPKFSNEPNSHCSSLGKYKIGERGYSSWGCNVKYLLHGLESSNNKALQRAVVFHSWEIIPSIPVYPVPVANSWGCPAVSIDNFKTMDTFLKQSKKPVLMWIYYESVE
jgi:hypothetical protein